MYKHRQPESWYTVSYCLSINMKELCQAVISQYRQDNMPSLYISEVQLSPKWHIDNNIHSCCIETKGKAFLIIDKQHIFTFPHFKMISPSSSTQCLQCEDVPIKNYRRTCLFRKAWQENTLPSVPALGEAINQLNFLFFFFFSLTHHIFWLLLLCFISHFIELERGKQRYEACNFECRYCILASVVVSCLWPCKVSTSDIL